MNTTDILSFTATALTMLTLDATWLYLRNGYHQKLFKDIQGTEIKPRIVPALLIYVILPVAVYVWAVRSSTVPIEAVQNGAFVGLILYAFYDLTNYATLTAYTFQMTLTDILWGTFLCTLGALAGFYVKYK